MTKTQLRQITLSVLRELAYTHRDWSDYYNEHPSAIREAQRLLTIAMVAVRKAPTSEQTP